MDQQTPGWKFYEKHLQYFYDKDIAGLVANDYNEDAIVMSYDFTVKGPEALRQLFTAYLDMIGEFQVVSTEQFRETEDAVLLEATLQTSKVGIRKVYDAFVFKNGKVSYHMTGLKA